jgi:hypothetical protein
MELLHIPRELGAIVPSGLNRQKVYSHPRVCLVNFLRVCELLYHNSPLYL